MEPPFARLEGRDLEYLMQKRRIVIGRNSKLGTVDVNMGNSRFISRKHLDIIMDKGMFYLICRGKNGVFVDDHFQRREVAKLPLPSRCVIRFPSTQVKIIFTTLTDVQTGIIPNVGISPGEITRLARLDPSHSPFVSPFVSPCPSPTGTISAINSCPGSPGHGPGRQRLPSFEVISQYASKLLQESSSSDGDGDGEGEEDDKENGELEIQETDGRNHNNDEDGDAEEEFPTPSISPSRNEPSEDKSEETHQKPLYSYAQLIVQALLGSKDRKQTLSGIYKFISTNYPYYKITDKGWKNSIRHNLSLNQYFTKAPRQPMSGKGGYWCMHPDFEDKLVAQAYTKRRKKGVPVFPTSGLISRSAPPSPTHHTYMGTMDFVLPSSQFSNTSSSSRPSTQGFRPPPPPQPQLHPLSTVSHTSSSQSCPGSPVRKNKGFSFKNYLSSTHSTEWVSEGGSSESPQPKKAKMDNGQESPEHGSSGKKPNNTAPSQPSMGIPYMALFAPVPLPFAGQFAPPFMPGPGQQSTSESRYSKDTSKESQLDGQEQLKKEAPEVSED